MLEGLSTPAPKVTIPEGWSPSITFDGNGGEAVLPPVQGDNPTDVESFLRDAGINPDEIEIVGEPRISRWQVARPFPLEPMWMTSVRIRWVKRNSTIDLPLLYSLAKKTKPVTPKPVAEGKALIVLWSDLQVGKVDHRGGIDAMILRVAQTQAALIAKVKELKPEKVIFADIGDTIEGFSSLMDMHQLQSNDLSLMQQIDLATSFAWETLKQLAKYAPITYLSVGSNHCQWRVNKQRIGKATDDWGTSPAGAGAASAFGAGVVSNGASSSSATGAGAAARLVALLGSPVALPKPAGLKYCPQRSRSYASPSTDASNISFITLSSTSVGFLGRKSLKLCN
jgi:hypothetical protein